MFARPFSLVIWSSGCGVQQDMQTLVSLPGCSLDRVSDVQLRKTLAAQALHELIALASAVVFFL